LLSVKKPVSLPVPVVVVGNLSVGGTGKTPLVIWVARFLHQQGFSPGIISRGYGGKVHVVPFFVDEECSAEVVGDEAVLIAEKSGLPMVVCSWRVEAVQCLGCLGIGLGSMVFF